LRSSPCRRLSDFDVPERSSLSLSLLSRVFPLWCRRLESLLTVPLPDGCLSCGFFPFSVFPTSGSHIPRRIPTLRLRCLLSVSHALKAFIRPMSAGLVSCRSRPWGFPFKASPPTERAILSDASSLMRLARPAATASDVSTARPPRNTVTLLKQPFREAALSRSSPHFRVCTLRVPEPPQN